MGAILREVTPAYGGELVRQRYNARSIRRAFQHKPIAGYNVEQITAQDKTGRLEAGWEKLARVKHLPREIIIERIQSTMHRTETAAHLFTN